MKVYILIPYLSNGIDVDLENVNIFESRSDAETHVHAFGFNYYDIVEAASALEAPPASRFQIFRTKTLSSGPFWLYLHVIKNNSYDSTRD